MAGTITIPLEEVKKLLNIHRSNTIEKMSDVLRKELKDIPSVTANDIDSKVTRAGYEVEYPSDITILDKYLKM